MTTEPRMYCTHCDNQVGSSDRICIHCGSVLVPRSAPPRRKRPLGLWFLSLFHLLRAIPLLLIGLAVFGAGESVAMNFSLAGLILLGGTALPAMLGLSGDLPASVTGGSSFAKLAGVSRLGALLYVLAGITALALAVDLLRLQKRTRRIWYGLAIVDLVAALLLLLISPVASALLIALNSFFIWYLRRSHVRAAFDVGPSSLALFPVALAGMLGVGAGTMVLHILLAAIK
jgi:hypothetical protein